MDDLWKFALYALAVGVYYFIKGRKPADKKAIPNPAKPFMSPAAGPEANTRPNPVNPRTPNAPSTPLEELLRRFSGAPQPMENPPKPMLEDKVRKAGQKLRPDPQSRSLESPSLEQPPDGRRLETVDYDDDIPQYRNEAADVNYEIPEKAGYKGLDDSGTRVSTSLICSRKKPTGLPPCSKCRYAAGCLRADRNFPAKRVLAFCLPSTPCNWLAAVHAGPSAHIHFFGDSSNTPASLLGKDNTGILI